MSAQPQATAQELQNSFFEAIKKGDIHEVKNLVGDPKLDINAVDKEGKTALHHATFKKNVPMMEHVLRAGAKLDAVDSKGKKPLDIAIENQHQASIILLVSLGAERFLKETERLPEDLSEAGTQDKAEYLIRRAVSAQKQAGKKFGR
jgi:ankyrin repeat protein